MDIITGILKASMILFEEMSPYLLFGFMFAGLLHVLVTPGTIAKHLGKRSSLSVVKASLFGIPLPLCSCGVIPAAMSLRKEGASKGAILSFLISTPTTGVDSIFATYSLLGGVFAIYRVLASFAAGVFSGILANIFDDDSAAQADPEIDECRLCRSKKEHKHTVAEKVKMAFTYAFVELISDTGRWLLLGVLIGGVIAFFMPEKFIHDYLGSGWRAMIVMLILGIPMYVCATGSIPIAAALMMKGMNPGAAFVFLMAGPATNAVSMTVISRNIGRKALIIYLVSIALCSVMMGGLLDRLWDFFQMKEMGLLIVHRTFLPGWLKTGSMAVLIFLIAFNMLFVKRCREGS